jgi:phosphomannomutase/phosphomannomutase/phosphoglucomutase
MSDERLPCFKAYDIRGRVPDELNEELAADVGRAFCGRLDAKKVVVGRDVRLSSESMAAALIDGLRDAGADVVDIGVCGTENVYFAAMHLEDEGVDGGVMVTASHNPMDYNGMKLVQRGAVPVSGDSGLRDIERMCATKDVPRGKARGGLVSRDLQGDYLDHLMGYLDVDALKPLSIVSNPGNGCAGPVVDALAARLPFTVHRVHHEPDGTFPHGVPNPLIEANRAPTRDAVREHGADVGLAWDGDFDRCFFFDESGAFVEGYYIVGLFAEVMLHKHAGAKIIYEPRLTWNTIDMIERAGGVGVMSKTGHAFIKERMRKEDAVYGGEMSAHHYFKDFAYCDSGMIPWLLMTEILSTTGKSMSELVAERQRLFPASGEINRKHADPEGAMAAVEATFGEGATIDRTDGLSIELADWRLNLRKSNTEPLLRLNVESRGDESLMRAKTDEVLAVVDSVGSRGG